MGDFADDYGGYDFYDRMELDEQRDRERRAQRAKLLTLPEPAQKPMHPELRKMWEDYFDKCFREFSAAQPAPVREDWGPGPHEYHSLPSEPAPVQEHEPENEPYVSLASVQEPVAWTLLLVGEHHGIIGKAGEKFLGHPKHYERIDVYTTPPAAQRQWVGLTDEDKKGLWIADQMTNEEWSDLFSAIEAKLRSKNT
jgi:hypothetical protein